jgi:hypothetical protein
MATESREMEDLAKISGALLVNIGTLRGECFDGMKKGGIPITVTYVHLFPLILVVQGFLPISSGSPLSLTQLEWVLVLSGKRPSTVQSPSE